jgi:hypothetical protein
MREVVEVVEGAARHTIPGAAAPEVGGDVEPHVDATGGGNVLEGVRDGDVLTRGA